MILFSPAKLGQIFIKNFLKGGQVISGHSVYGTLFSAQTDLFSLFFLSISEHY